MYGNSIWQDIKYEFNKGDTIIRLIFLNIVVFVLMNLGTFIFNIIMDNQALAAAYQSIFTLPADLGKLVRRPWTILTHMFAHGGIFHILFNMLWLYWMGRILREFLGDSKILPLYIYGALTGAALYIISFNLLAGFSDRVPFAEALGASAAVMAIVIATATLLPDYSIGLLFFGQVKLKWLALVFILFDIVGINGMNAGGSIAHLGGALFGYIFIKQLQRGNDFSRGFNKLQDSVMNLFSGRRKPKVSYKNTSRIKDNSARAETHSNNKDQQERLDAILDKIAQSGYDSLSKDEKEFLFRVSKDE